MYGLIAVVVVMLYAIAILFVFPMREVTQPPGKLQKVWEVLFPGTSPGWHIPGGIVLVVWCYFVVQDAFLFKVGTPRIIAFIATPNLTRSCGVPAPSGEAGIFKLLNPSWVWLYLAPAVLFVVNLLLVFRDRLFRKSP